MVCRNCVNAKSVATGMRRTSPRCLNPKKTVVIITSSNIMVIIPRGIRLVDMHVKKSNTNLHIATVEIIPYDLTRLLRLSVTMTSTTSGGT